MTSAETEPERPAFDESAIPDEDKQAATPDNADFDADESDE